METLMTTAGYAYSPHDVPPVEISPPKTFENIDFYPSAAFNASHRTVATFCQVVKREDEHGVCLVSHFEVAGTLVILYQSALDLSDHWTVFADMRSCVDKQQVPTKLGLSVVRYLTNGSIKPDWLNKDADAVYRSGRRKRSKAGSDVAQSPSKAINKSFLLAPSTSRRYRDTRADFPMVGQKVSDADRIRSLIAKKAATSSPYAAKKATAAAPKSAAKPAAVKKAPAQKGAAAPMRTGPKKAAVSKK
jgi:hypothetical protein